MFSKGYSDKFLKDFESSVTDRHVLSYYLHVDSVPCLISAPYRNDKHPSLSIYESNGKIRFRDFATGYSGGMVDLLMRMWNCSFARCSSMIANDLEGIKSSIPSTVINNDGIATNQCHQKKVDIKVKIREWRKYDLEYWESYGISKEWLEFGEIYPISRIFYISDNGTSDYPAEKYAYVYIERKDGIVTYKIYQPKSVVRKWINKHDSSVWDLWTKLPERGERLIITSSRKDALCIWENTGIPSVSLQGEGYVPKEHVINELKSRFSYVFILYDNDFSSEENHGRMFATELSQKFNLIMIEIPDEYKSKDTSDLCLNHGRETVNKVITGLVEDKIEEIDGLPF